jgi:hypothetical protein
VLQDLSGGSSIVTTTSVLATNSVVCYQDSRCVVKKVQFSFRSSVLLNLFVNA